MSTTMLSEARKRVAEMWHNVAKGPNPCFRADANDTLFFVHEEASEVTKAAMQMGLLGSREYHRSDETMAKDYSFSDLIGEVGDVILMALTLAQAFDLDPGVCLGESLNKFYNRAGLPMIDWDDLADFDAPQERKAFDGWLRRMMAEEDYYEKMAEENQPSEEGESPDDEALYNYQERADG